MRKRLSLLGLAISLSVAAVVAGCNSTQVSSGILYQNQGNHVKAVNMFRLALWYNVEEAAAHYQLAYSLSELAKMDAAAGEVDSSRDKISEAFDEYLLAAQYGPEKYGMPPEETPDEPAPIELNIRSNYSHFFNRAVQFNSQQQFQDAATWFNLAYHADPRGEAGFNARIAYAKLTLNLAAEDDDTEQIEEVLDLLDSLEPPDSEAKADLTNTMANGLLMLGKRDEAAQLYEELLAESPNDIALLTKVAEARIEREDRDGAAELLERVVSLVQADPDMSQQDKWRYAFLAAQNYESAERYEDCLRMTDIGLEYASNTQERSFLIRMNARSHYELENWDAAIAAAERLFELLPDDKRGWQIYYLSLNNAGRTDEALRARERYQEL